MIKDLMALLQENGMHENVWLHGFEPVDFPELSVICKIMEDLPVSQEDMECIKRMVEESEQEKIFLQQKVNLLGVELKNMVSLVVPEQIQNDKQLLSHYLTSLVQGHSSKNVTAKCLRLIEDTVVSIVKKDEFKELHLEDKAKGNEDVESLALKQAPLFPDLICASNNDRLNSYNEHDVETQKNISSSELKAILKRMCCLIRPLSPIKSPTFTRKKQGWLKKRKFEALLSDSADDSNPCALNGTVFSPSKPLISKNLNFDQIPVDVEISSYSQPEVAKKQKLRKESNFELIGKLNQFNGSIQSSNNLLVENGEIVSSSDDLTESDSNSSDGSASSGSWEIFKVPSITKIHSNSAAEAASISEIRNKTDSYLLHVEQADDCMNVEESDSSSHKSLCNVKSSNESGKTHTSNQRDSVLTSARTNIDEDSNVLEDSDSCSSGRWEIDTAVASPESCPNVPEEGMSDSTHTLDQESTLQVTKSDTEQNPSSIFEDISSGNGLSIIVTHKECQAAQESVPSRIENYCDFDSNRESLTSFLKSLHCKKDSKQDSVAYHQLPQKINTSLSILNTKYSQSSLQRNKITKDIERIMPESYSHPKPVQRFMPKNVSHSTPIERNAPKSVSHPTPVHRFLPKSRLTSSDNSATQNESPKSLVMAKKKNSKRENSIALDWKQKSPRALSRKANLPSISGKSNSSQFKNSTIFLPSSKSNKYVNEKQASSPSNQFQKTEVSSSRLKAISKIEKIINRRKNATADTLVRKPKWMMKSKTTGAPVVNNPSPSKKELGTEASSRLFPNVSQIENKEENVSISDLEVVSDDEDAYEEDTGLLLKDSTNSLSEKNCNSYVRSKWKRPIRKAFSESVPSVVASCFTNLNVSFKKNYTLVDRTKALIDALQDVSLSPDTESIVFYVLKYFSLQRNNPLNDFKKQKDPSVFFSPFEERVVSVLFDLENSGDRFKDLILSVVINIRQLILAVNNLSNAGSCALCRIYAIICKSKSNKREAIAFCVDILKIKHKLGSLLIATMVGVWNDLFDIPYDVAEDEAVFYGSLRLKAQQWEGRGQGRGCTSSDWEASKCIIEKYISATPVKPTENTVHFLIESIKEKCIKETYAKEYLLTTPLILFASYCGYHWAKVHIIDKYLVPYISNCVDSETNSRALTLFCKLYAEICLFYPENAKPEKVLYELFEAGKESEESKFMEVAAAPALVQLLLTRDKPLPEDLRDWYRENEDNPSCLFLKFYFHRNALSNKTDFTEEDIL